MFLICKVLTDFPVRRDYKDVTDRGQVSKTSVPVWVLSTSSERDWAPMVSLACRRCGGMVKQLVAVGDRLLGWGLGVQAAVVEH